MVDAKRIFVFVLIGMFLVSFMAGFVGAAITTDGGVAESIGEKLAEFTKGFGRGTISFANGLFGKSVLESDSLSRLFMALLVAMFVYTAFESFFSDDKYKWIRWVATIAATALAMIGLPTGFLDVIEANFGAMGGAVLSVIPFLIIFWFSVRVGSFLMARIVWFFYFVYYLALMISGFVKNSTGTGHYFYGLAALMGFLIFIFILKIRGFIFHGEMKGLGEELEKKAKERGVYLKGERQRLVEGANAG